jgi:AcrR family transcriptional regulator
MTRERSTRGPGRPRGADGAETREEILRSAREVFSSTGFGRASLQQIAQHAGITRNAIANYYPNKIELHRAAFGSIRDAVTYILDRASTVDSPARSRVIAVFEAAIEVSKNDATFVRFLITSTVDSAHHPELGDQSPRQLAVVRDFIRESLDAGKKRGEIASDLDNAATAQVLVDLLWGLAMDTGFFSDRQRTRRTLKALVHMIDMALRT